MLWTDTSGLLSQHHMHRFLASGTQDMCCGECLFSCVRQHTSNTTSAPTGRQDRTTYPAAVNIVSLAFQARNTYGTYYKKQSQPLLQVRHQWEPAQPSRDQAEQQPHVCKP